MIIIDSAEIFYATQRKIYVRVYLRSYQGSIVDNNGPPRQSSR